MERETDLEPTDEMLMTRVAEGDLEALRTLYERYRERLFGFLWRATGRPDVADDLVQETFLRVVSRGGTWRPDGALRPWIFQIARSVLADRFRGRESRTASLEAVSDPVAPTEDPGERVDRERRAARLRRALDRLSVEDRHALVLSRYEGMRYAEIGRVLGCTEGAVKVRIHRALKRLRDHYVDTIGGEGERCTSNG